MILKLLDELFLLITRVGGVVVTIHYIIYFLKSVFSKVFIFLIVFFKKVSALFLR